MEDADKKKRKNKKKKNKQNKTTPEEETVNVGGEHPSCAENGDDGGISNTDSDLDRHRAPNGAAETSILTEVQNQQRMQREAALQERIIQLQDESVSHIQKKNQFEGTVKQLQIENNSHIERETRLKAALEKTIEQLRNVKDSSTQKEAGLEKEIVQLQYEKDLWLQKEASIEEKVKQLESEKYSWNVTETTTKETIARMNVDITRLRMQVVELEESRNSALKENHQLVESISALRLQVQNFEIAISSSNVAEELRKSELEELNSQIEAAHVLVDKLITENSELVEKVNELCIKIDQKHSGASRLSMLGETAFVAGNVEMASISNHISATSENVSSLDQEVESLEAEPAGVVPYRSEADSGEIVHIPLDDNEVQDLESQAVESNKKDDVVSLTDAPMIGAPFRLVSFVAKYVSGADLVDKSTSAQGP